MAMEEGLAQAAGAFEGLDAQMAASTRVATKLGERLHVRPCCALGPLLITFQLLLLGCMQQHPLPAASPAGEKEVLHACLRQQRWAAEDCRQLLSHDINVAGM